MKIIFRKKIVLFKIKNVGSTLYKLLFLKAKNKLLFFVFGSYFKVFFDLGLNIYGTIPFWLNKITGFTFMRELAFFKIFCINKKIFKHVRNYNLFFNNIIKRSKQGYFLEFKVVGYFRAKRITLLPKNKKLQKISKSFVLLYLGYSHLFIINMKNSISFVRGKRRFMFFTSNKQDFETIIRQIFYYKPFNVYKIKGLRTPLNIKKMKPGKQKQQKKIIKK